jgi:hypothetical protein
MPTPGQPHVSKPMDSPKFPADPVIKFHGMELRLAAVTELIQSQADNVFYQIAICARYFKEGAHKELFPTRKSFPHLSREQRNAIYRRAIEMAEQDSANGTLRP